MSWTRRTGLARIGLCVALAQLALSQEVCHESVIVAPDTWPAGAFGQVLHIHGDLLAIADPDWFGTVALEGSVYVYRRSGDTWALDGKVGSGDPDTSQQFGIRTRTDGQRVYATSLSHTAAVHPIVGGSISVFERTANGWRLRNRAFDAANGAFLDDFGLGFDVDGGRILAHCRDGVMELQEGPTGWIETDRLVFQTDIPAAMLAQLGGSFHAWQISMDGDRAILVQANEALYLEHDGTAWQPVQALTAAPGQSWGASVALDSDWLVLGGPDQANLTGRVHVYHHDGASWVPHQVLTPPTPATGNWFGSAVDLCDGRLLVSSPGHDAPGAANSGALDLYSLNDQGIWTHVEAILPSQPEFTAQMGRSVSLDERGWAIAGAPTTSTAAIGHAIAFRLRTPLGVPLPDPPPNSSGLPARLTAVGSPEVDDDCLTLRVDRLPSNAFGYFLMGREQDHVPLFGGSQGLLSLGLPLVRFANAIQHSGPAGSVEFTPSLTALPQNTVVLPGETWTFQYWTRDLNPGPASNTSNALAVTFEGHAGPTVQFPVAVRVEPEETALIEVAVTLSQPAIEEVLVPFTVGGTATHLVDWRVEAVSPLVIPAGETSVALPIVIAEDLLQEGDETATVTLGAPTGATLGSQATLTLRIADDD